MSEISDNIVIATPKGRVAKEIRNILKTAGIEPEQEFYNEESRRLRFTTNHESLSLIRVRSFDAATFVAFGAAQIGIVGSDVLAEFNYSDIYSPLDLNIGHCRLVVAEPAALYDQDAPAEWSHIRIATKYPNLTEKHFAQRGVQAECIKLHGALELAPSMGLCRRIVDLVSTGETLKANGLVEVETIMDVSSRLIINKAAWKTRTATVSYWHDKFKELANDT